MLQSGKNNQSKNIELTNEYIFGLVACELVDRKGQKYACDLKPGDKTKENINNYVGETEEVIVEINAVYDENTVALKALAVLKEKQPYFGKQRFFHHQAGLKIELSIENPDKSMAIYQHKDWWLRPAFVTNLKELPARTQLLMWKKDSLYYVMIALCGNECRSDIGAGQQGLIISVSNNCESMTQMEDVVLVMANGEDPYQCCENVVKKALQLTGKNKMLRKERKYPQLFDYFGWCSWDAFYHKVHEQGIFDKLQELKEKEIPVKWALIDDGWLDADYEKQKLRGLDADKEKFPKGLGYSVSVMKEKYGLDAVGVWQAIMGYWNGIETGSGADIKMTPYLEQLPDGRRIPRATQGDTFSFWNEWHSYLKNQCGIDFVKVDGQSAVSLFQWGRKTYSEASSEVQKGLGASVALNFDNYIINCMGMAPEDMWSRPSSAISRSSDDFVPEVAHGFREHAIQNSYNSLLQGQLFWGDWDMFFSSHEENWQNSILRAVSGGPVYVSDAVGMTDKEYIMPLILDDGRVLRCDEIGVPTMDCLFEDPLITQKPLKIFNSHQSNYLIAAFNINRENQRAKGQLSVEDIPGLKVNSWWVYVWRTKKLVKISKENPLDFVIEANNGEIFLLVPSEESAKVIPIGLIDKYLSTATIKEVNYSKKGMEVILAQGGTFGFISKNSPYSVLVNDKKAQAIQLDSMLWEVDCISDQKVRVEITY